MGRLLGYRVAAINARRHPAAASKNASVNLAELFSIETLRIPVDNTVMHNCVPSIAPNVLNNIRAANVLAARFAGTDRTTVLMAAVRVIPAPAPRIPAPNASCQDSELKIAGMMAPRNNDSFSPPAIKTVN